MIKRVICIALCFSLALAIMPALAARAEDPVSVTRQGVTVKYPSRVAPGEGVAVSVEFDSLDVMSCGVRVILPEGFAFVSGVWNAGNTGDPFIKANAICENGYIHAAVINYGDETVTLDGEVFSYAFTAAQTEGSYVITIEFSNEGEALRTFPLDIIVTNEAESSEGPEESSSDEPVSEEIPERVQQISVPLYVDAIHGREFALAIHADEITAKSIGVLLKYDDKDCFGFVSGVWNSPAFTSAFPPFIVANMSYDAVKDKISAAVLTYQDKSLSQHIIDKDIFIICLAVPADAEGVHDLTVTVSIEDDAGRHTTIAYTVSVNIQGHEWEVQSEEPATCAAAGTRHSVCSYCGAQKDESIPIDLHNHTGETELRNYLPATHDADGYTGDVYCVGCGSMLEQGEFIPALRRLPDVCGENFYFYYIGDTQYVMITGVVDLLPPGVVETDPDGAGVSGFPFAAGDKLRLVSGDNVLDEAIIAVKGDLDRDGDVDSNDAIYLLRHVLFPGDFPF
ncbi:MAG: hypothetical protein IJK33_02345 [Clostridia bacterium]|nr:hypothetical protein [Clostridia bacterium]